jgi:hypothetical protein
MLCSLCLVYTIYGFALGSRQSKSLGRVMDDFRFTDDDELRLELLYWEKLGKLRPLGPCCAWPSPLSRVPNMDWEAMFSVEQWAIAA